MEEFLGDIIENVVENVIERIDEPKNLRYRRGLSGFERAAKASREKKAAVAAAAAAAESRAHRAHLLKLTNSCASDVGFQVLFLSSLLRDFLFPV